MKKLYLASLLMMLILLPGRALGQKETTSKFVFPAEDGFLFLATQKNKNELGRLFDFVEKYRSVIRSGAIVYIRGYCDIYETSAENIAGARERAEKVRTELIDNKELRQEDFIISTFTGSRDGNRGMVEVEITIPAGADAIIAAAAAALKDAPIPEVHEVEDTPENARKAEREQLKAEKEALKAEREQEKLAERERLKAEREAEKVAAAQAKEAERAQQDAATGEEIADSVEDTASELTAEEVELARQKAEREAVKAERAAEKARLKAEREAEKGAEAQAKEVAKAEREAEKAAAAQAKEVEKAKSVKENDATRAKDEPADRDAEEAAAAREAEKAAAAREKELEKAAREKEKTAQAKEREKEKAAAARTKEIERAKSDAEKQRNKPAPRQVASRSGAAGVPAFSLRTNLLHWLALVPNAGFEWRVSRTVGVRLDGGWSGWEAGKGISAKYHRLFYANPEVRFYFSAQSKFYLGVGGTMGQFNIKLGDKTGYQGDAWGASASAGYMLRLTRALSMDFNIGLGYMDFRYDTFRTDEDGMRIYKLKNRHSGLFGPTQCGVTLVWRLGRR